MFPYSKLPKELKSLSLKSTAIDDISQLLRTNKQLRQEVLRNGPFPPKRIDCLEIQLPIYRRKISSESPYECVFAVSFKDLGLVFHISDSEVEMVGEKRWRFNIKGRSFWFLSRRISSIKTLLLGCSPHFGHGDLAEREFENLLDRSNFLPNLHIINEWEITSNSIEFLDICFTRLPIRDFNRLKLKVDWEGKEGKEINKFLKSLSQRENLSCCSHFVWAGNQIPWKQITPFHQKLSIYEIESILWPKFVNAPSKFLKETRLKTRQDTVFLIQAKYFTNETVDELFEEFIGETLDGLDIHELEEKSEDVKKLAKYLTSLGHRIEQMSLKDPVLAVGIHDTKRKNYYFRKECSDQIVAIGCASIFPIDHPPTNPKKDPQFAYQIFVKYFSERKKSISQSIEQSPMKRKVSVVPPPVIRRKISTDYVRKTSQKFEAIIQKNSEKV